jgi:hypothetical protein
MPLFGPRKLGRIDFAYYWGRDERLEVTGDLDEMSQMKAEALPASYIPAWITVHQMWSLPLEYKGALRDGLEPLLRLGEPAPLQGPLLPAKEEDMVITLCTDWYEHGSGSVQPQVRHNLGPGARSRGLTIEAAVVRAVVKIWRYFVHEMWCESMHMERSYAEWIQRDEAKIRTLDDRRAQLGDVPMSQLDDMLTFVGLGLAPELDVDYKLLPRFTISQFIGLLEAQLKVWRAYLEGIRQGLKDELPEALSELRGALRDLIDDWDENGFPHGIGGAQRIPREERPAATVAEGQRSKGKARSLETRWTERIRRKKQRRSR